MMRRLVSLFLSAALAVALLLLSGCGAEKKYTVSWFDVFDTVVLFTGYAPSESAWNKQADAVHEDLLRYHRLFDIYNEYDGLVNLATVNRTAAQTPVAVDGELYQFLKFGREIYSETEGACNIAAGAVLRLWHDARELPDPLLPDEGALQTAATHCDMTCLVLDDAAQTVYFADPALKLDVGAIGKGYAVEQAAQAAQARGLTACLLNAGGNVRAIGSKPGGEKWTAGVENPWVSGGPLVAALELSDGESLVISGDYQRYFEVDGVRYHHLIDLSTSQPARYFSAVAVRTTGGSGWADALSTGLFCMPEEQGQALVASLSGVEALWMHHDETVTGSAGFANPDYSS